jgi:putative glutamine amidotransferase
VSRPLIGVTTSEVRLARHTHPLPEADPPQPEMALGVTYARAVERAGGLPVVLPPLEADAVAPLVSQLSAVCLSGGPDLDPASYDADRDPSLGPIEPALDAFELAVARQADALGIPILGICRGCQTLNVARGGTLHQHLPDVTDGSVEHRQTASGRLPTHGVRIERGSRLNELVGAEELEVNSFHHQAADRLGGGLRAVAWAPDGVVEAIESEGEPFYLGVQWHVEGLVDRPRHLALFTELVSQAARYAQAPTQARAA